MKKASISILIAVLVTSLTVIFKKTLQDDLIFAILFAIVSAGILFYIQKDE